MMGNLAAIQTYASEGYLEQALGESKHVWQFLESQSVEFAQKWLILQDFSKLKKKKKQLSQFWNIGSVVPIKQVFFFFFFWPKQEYICFGGSNFCPWLFSLWN